MFSKLLVKLTVIFVFCIAATSATPPGQPGEVQNTNDDIHARATKPYQCEDPFVWVRRECVGAIDPTAWHDVCVWKTFSVFYDYQPGNCPGGTTCLDSFSTKGPFISCISENTGNPTGKQKSDPQVGTSDTKRGRTELGNTQQKFSVKVDHDMDDASVAAIFQSVDYKFLIAPNNVIVGNVHGYRENVCHGDKSNPTKARECYPNGTYNFEAGQTIDFTWGMTGNQEGVILYGILPVGALVG